MIKLRTILLYDSLYIILASVIILYSILWTNFSHYQSKYNIDTKEINGYIHDINIDGDKLTLTIIGREKIIGYYYFETKEEKNTWHLKLGDYIKLEGIIKEPKNNTIFNLFNYKKYLYYHQIFYLFEIKNIKKIKGNNKIRYTVKQFIIDRINNITKTKEYLQTFILGDNNINKSIRNTYQINGISHLLAISGMHIALLSFILLSFLKKLKIDENKRYLIVNLFLLFFLFLTNYSPSVERATIFFIFLSINSIYYFHVKTINILLLTLSFLLIFDPFLLYNVGFQYSFLISFYLILFQSLINKYTNYLSKLFMVSLISFVVSIPITAYNFYQINILSPIINLLFVPLVSIIIFPLSLLTFLFPFLDSILNIFIYLMEILSSLISSIKIGQIILAKPHIILIGIYYFVITLVLISLNNKKYHYCLILIFLIFIHQQVNFFNFNPYLVFIDVNQGDAVLINLPYNKGTVLVDTGGKLSYPKEEWQIRKNKYSLGKDNLIPYFKSLGINHLDYLIITHGDADHIGESFSLIDNFKVKEVLLNDGCLSSLETKLIKQLNKKKIPYKFKKAGDIIKINSNYFYFLNSITDTNENDNSLVLYANLNNKKVLLTGDISSKIEEKLINAYNLNEVDILKIGHHGSITSSSELFLDYVKPKYAIIEVGLNNKFNHPSEIVLNRLKKRRINTYLTSVNGSIKFVLTKNNVTIRAIQT